MIKNIMKNIGTRPPKMGSKEYNELYGISEEDARVGAQVDKIYERQLKRIKELRAKGLTDEQIDNDNIIKQTKEDMKNVGKKPVDAKEEVKEDVDSPEDDILSGFNLTAEEHSMDGYKANAKMYPALQSLVKQREPFFQKRIEAWKKLKENPNNPKARADFIDATNAISQIDSDLDRAYKKETAE